MVAGINWFLTQINCPCTSGCTSENCRKRGPTREPTAPSPTTNVTENIKEAQEAALKLCQATPPQSSSTKTHRRSHLASSREEMSGLPYRRVPTPPTQPQFSPRPQPPTPPHRRPSRTAKEIQILHDQRTVKPRQPVYLPTKTVMSRGW